MKIIGLIFALLSFNLYAQDFPAPYCDIDPDGTTVEEITTVSFAEVGITNTDTSSILVDATDTNGFMNHGDSYLFTVTGNTVGNFDNDIVAFIDWNNNEILDDDNEVYAIGTLTNSNGNDGATVSLEISAPNDAEFNSAIRVRVTKTYTDEDSPAELDPCAIAFNPFNQGVFPGYGQALDFTLKVGLIGVEEFNTNNLSMYPVPASNILNIEYASNITLIEVYNVLGQHVLSQSNLGASIQLNTAALNPGTYFVNIFAAGESHIAQMVKI